MQNKEESEGLRQLLLAEKRWTKMVEVSITNKDDKIEHS